MNRIDNLLKHGRHSKLQRKQGSKAVEGIRVWAKTFMSNHTSLPVDITHSSAFYM